MPGDVRNSVCFCAGHVNKMFQLESEILLLVFCIVRAIVFDRQSMTNVRSKCGINFREL